MLTDYYILPFSQLCHLLNPGWWDLDQSGVRVIEFSAKLQNDKDKYIKDYCSIQTNVRELILTCDSEIFILNLAPICLIVHIQEEYCAKLGGGMRHRSQKGDTNEVDEEEIGQRAGKKIGLGGDRTWKKKI